MQHYLFRKGFLIGTRPKNKSNDPVKETAGLIRLARSYWNAHSNLACRTHREMAIKLFLPIISSGQNIGDCAKLLRDKTVWLIANWILNCFEARNETIPQSLYVVIERE